MCYRFSASVLYLVLLLPSLADAQEGPRPYLDRASFASASSGLSVVDFEGTAPSTGFRQYKREGAFSTSGIEFRPTGRARFGAGFVLIVGASYKAGPIYETGTGAKLIWGPPNQPGSVDLDVSVPGGTTAVGVDLWTAQPYVSTVDVVANTADGGTRRVTVNTVHHPASAFVGFTADSPITSLRFTLPKGQTALILDNFTFGRKAKGGSLIAESTVVKRETLSPANSNSSPLSSTAASRPSTRQTPLPIDTPTLPGGQVRKPGGISTGGTIAYIRGSTEIRLIAPDGTGDRRLWTHKDANRDIGINQLAWRPDGKELAFSSGHAAVTSLYYADIYAIRLDGSGFRKLTNPPDRSEFARFPKGNISVTVRNDQAADVGSATFIIYVAGADEPQQVVLPPGTTKTLLFRSVADFGNKAQPIVAMFGKYRWFIPGLDVQAGRTINAPIFSISGKGFDLFGAFRPIWRSDSSRVSYRSGLCVLSSVAVNPSVGDYSFNPMFSGPNPLGTCAWDWGPTPATANQIIYTENAGEDSSVYKIAEGGTHPGTKLTTFSDIQYQLLSDLRWLPDATGFLFSNVNLMRESSNIYRYDFGTKRLSQLTRFDNEFSRAFSISPDGRSVVFERCKSYDEDTDCDLWITSTEGGEPTLLVRNGQSPSWGK